MGTHRAPCNILKAKLKVNGSNGKWLTKFTEAAFSNSKVPITLGVQHLVIRGLPELGRKGEKSFPYQNPIWVIRKSRGPGTQMRINGKCNDSRVTTSNQCSKKCTRTIDLEAGKE